MARILGHHARDATTTPRERCLRADFAIDTGRGLLDWARAGAVAQLRRPAGRRRARADRRARHQPAARRVRRPVDRPAVHQQLPRDGAPVFRHRRRPAGLGAPAGAARRRGGAVRAVPPPRLACGGLVVAGPRALQRLSRSASNSKAPIDSPYESAQYAVLARVIAALCRSLSRRSSPERVVGHSDVAPGRKTDPGMAFDWPRLRSLVQFELEVAPA